MFQKNPYLKKSYRFNRPRKKDNSEGRLVMQIIHFLKTRGHTCGKTKTTGLLNQQGRWCKDPYLFKGFPDITAFTPELLFIECKFLGGKQTEEQKAFQELCQKACIPYLFARRLEDVVEFLK